MSGEVWRQASTGKAFWFSRGAKYDERAVVDTLNNLLSRRPSMKAKLPGGQWLQTDGRSDVLASSWSKDTTNPAGVFSISLKSHQDYLRRIQPGDLIIPFQSSAGGEGKVMTLGVVDRVGRSTSVNEDGVTVRSVSVSGRDLGTLLAETSVTFDLSLEGKMLSAAFFKTFTGDAIAALSPVETVLTLFRIFFNAQASGSKIVDAQWRFPGSTGDFDINPENNNILRVQGGLGLAHLIDTETFVQAPMFGYAMPEPQGLGAGNMWTLLDSMSNRVVNEFFVDVRDLTSDEVSAMDHLEDVAAAFVSPKDAERQRALKSEVAAGFQTLARVDEDIVRQRRAPTNEAVVALVHRQMPYDTDAFYRLPNHVVHSSEVREVDVSFASHDVYNFFRLRSPTMPPDVQERTFGLKVNLASIMAYGIRRLEAETRYPFTDRNAATAFHTGESQTIGGFHDVYAYYVGLLSTWYAFNEKMLSGTMNLRHRPEIRVGHRVEFREQEPDGTVRVTDFYVQGVHHNFQFGAGASASTLTLVRGVPHDPGGGHYPETSLYWNKSGSAIPPDFNPFIRVAAAGMVLEGDSEQAIIGSDADLSGFTGEDPSDS